MSGIVGIINLDGAPMDEGLLGRMTDSMAYRGPDARAVWVDGPVGFGHRLLRTWREPQDDRQPASRDGRLWITADASLDGRADLVRLLEAHGCPATEQTSDAQLILRAYEAWGENCVDHLLGDFAFAIWNACARRLFCARDHLGVKPFYYALAGNCLVFSNTLSSVRLHPAVSAELNDHAIGDFLLFGYNQDVATTTFADIARLPPAHVLTWSAASFALRRYWTLPAEEDPRHRRTGDYVDEFRTLWRTAVDDRLRADRVGVVMSGGLDSTSVAVTAHACLSARSQPFDLRAYTLVYDRLIPDRERHYAGLVATALNIPIHYLPADDYALFDRLDEVACQTPEPADNPLPAMTADLFREVARRCRVALTGDGGDPALGGPTRSHFVDLLKDGRAGRLIKDLTGCLAHGQRPPLGIRAALQRWTRNGRSHAAFPPWISPDFAARIDLRRRWKHVMEEPQRPPVSRAAYREFCSPFWPSLFETYDPGYTSFPLQVRHPFFDVRLLTHLLSVPLIPWLLSKKILRDAMRGNMPEPVRLRPKTPIVAEPICALLQQTTARRIDEFAVTPELLKYVKLDRVPRLTGLSTDLDQHERGWQIVTRPRCLNHWLAHAGSPPAARKEPSHGGIGASERI